MKNIKTVGIKELKNNLSAFIREIKRGFRILVTDRNQVVAELCEPLSQRIQSTNPLIDLWIREGKLHMPIKAKKDLPRSPLKFPEHTSLKLLQEDRDE